METIKDNIEKYGKSEDSNVYIPQIWRNIKTLEEFFYCNKEFIKGNIYGSCYHLGPLCEDSLPLVPDLIQLHDKGFLTTDGQGSLLTYDKYIPKMNYFLSAEQRPYLEGFIKNKYIDDILKYINDFNSNTIEDREDKIMYIIHTKNENITNIQLDSIMSPIVLHRESKIHYVTRSKIYDTIEQKNNKFWNEITHISTLYSLYEMVDGYFREYDSIKSEIIENYSLLTLSTEKYGSNISLEKFLLNFFAVKN
jgi:hypothetical protein